MMKYLVLFLVALVVTVGGNPALMTSNTYPGTSAQNGQYQNQGYQGYQYQNQNPQQQQQQQQQGYPRPLYRNGMLSPVNYTPYLQTRDAPMRILREINPQEQEMRILPYPSQYTAQNRNQQQMDNNQNGY